VSQFFVSVPFVMSWVFSAIRLIVSAETSRKFTVLSYASNLAGELQGVDKEGLPKKYGGASGKGLAELAVCKGLGKR
jgi:hypothetical protein